MASRVSSRRWLLREVPQAYVLLVLVAFVVSIFTYFIDWPTVRRKSAVQPTNNTINQRYSGSIIIPMGMDMCWTIMLDNRTGNMRDGGHIKCAEATGQFSETISPERTRLREVSKSFRHKDN
jgi:hypothetical protein